MADSVQVAVGVFAGKVVTRWQTPCEQIEFDPKNAYTVGLAMARAAREAHEGKPAPDGFDAFFSSEAKMQIGDEHRLRIISVAATMLRTLIARGDKADMIAIHVVDAVLQETTR